MSDQAAARPRRRVAPFAALAVALVVAGLFWVLAGSDPDAAADTQTYLLDRPAPAVISERFDGQTFDLSRRKGSWVVLNFFDSTCAPCRAEHPDLVEFADQQALLGVAGAELYTVVNRDDNAAVQRWFDENGGSWPIVKDDDGRIATDFGVAQVPETWIIDPNGVIRARYPGPTTFESLANTMELLRRGTR